MDQSRRARHQRSQAAARSRQPVHATAQPPQPKGDITQLWKLLGVDFCGDNVVWQNYNPYPKLARIPHEWVFVDHGSGAKQPFNLRDPITSKLQQVLFLFPGAVTGLNSSPLKFTELVSTSDHTGTIRYDQIHGAQLHGSAADEPGYAAAGKADQRQVRAGGPDSGQAEAGHDADVRQAGGAEQAAADEDAKADEKPEAAKPDESQPAEAQSAETKPTETEAGRRETGRGEARRGKPAETKPAEAPRPTARSTWWWSAISTACTGRSSRCGPRATIPTTSSISISTTCRSCSTCSTCWPATSGLSRFARVGRRIAR